MHRHSLLAAVLIFIPGCQSGAPSLPLLPGLWTGQGNWTNSWAIATADGLTDQMTDTASGHCSVTVSENGLPLWEGVEVTPGVQMESVIGGTGFLYTVTDVFADPTGVVVDYDAAGILLFGGYEWPFIGEGRMTYKIVGDAMEVTDSCSMGYVDAYGNINVAFEGSASLNL